MRLTRVYVDAPLQSGEEIELPRAAAQHLGRVLRLDAGAALTLFNGHGGEFDAVISSVTRSAMRVRVGGHHLLERESPVIVTLLQGISRGEKMDLILQKATELGVTRIFPVSMARGTVRLDEAGAAGKHEHWQGVIASACEQCGRNRLPHLEAVQTFSQSIRADTSIVRLLLAPSDVAHSLPQLLQKTADGRQVSISLLVGPEGGFDEAEIGQAAAAGFEYCRMGPRILRTETAALVALAALQTLMGDLR
jgi:16S rRNA (uracil1498-N3)-methyltransferase